jgi:hypothetical protein
MTTIANLPGVKEVETIRFFGNALALAADLAAIKGSTFMSVKLSADMLETDRRGALKRMNKRGNPFLAPGKSLQKFTDTQVSVNFDYAAKVERRGGEAPETHGNWSQAVIVNNHVSPLSTHKDDVVTVLETDPTKAICDDKGQIVDCVANRRAVLDAEGNVQFTCNNPRLYLRAEIQRNAGDEPREDRKMRSKSVYIDETGAIVPPEQVEPYLKSRSERTDGTDMVVYDIGNVVELKAGGLTYRNRLTEIVLRTWPVAV